MYVSNLESITLKLASPQDIMSWSYGEVTKPETINYRTQRPEKDGLFCEKIFGPTKDYECYCGKYKRIRYKGVICDRCGVEVTKSSVRRDRMGHIKLAAPVSHIWFLKGVPSRIGLVLGLPFHKVEEVIYFISYIVTDVNEDLKEKVLSEIEEEFKIKTKDKKNELSESKEGMAEAIDNLKKAKDKAKQEVQSIKPLAVFSEIEYHRLALKYGEIFDAGTGAEVIKEIFEKIDLSQEIEKLSAECQKSSAEEQKNLLRRLKLFKDMQKAQIRPEWMFLDVLPVLPPDLRPMVQLDGGRYASSDLNDLYRRVINRNNRLKYLLEIDAPDVIVRNEKRMLQEAVDALIDNKMRKSTTTTQATTGGRRTLKSLADMLQGKQGRFRQNLLGKRVDYSGRSVIVVGPNLKLSECGVPKKMALELFKPFVIKKLLDKELAYNVRGASKLIEEETDEIWESLEEVVREKVVLLNRAPTLHRLGIQGFYPILIEGEALRLHPLVCTAFNADFDGDQMAIHLPLSEEAQKEAREKMLSSANLLKPATGDPITLPTKDMVLGAYYLTKVIEGAKGEGRAFSSFNEAKIAYETRNIDLRAKIKVLKDEDIIETTVGRILFNEIVPEDMDFQNDTMNSKNLKALTSKVVEIHGNDAYKFLDDVKALGFEYSTRSSVSWGMDDLKVPKQKKEMLEEAEKKIEAIQNYYEQGLLSDEEKIAQVIEVWKNVKTEIEKLVPKALDPKSSVFNIVDSGARGSWSQPVQMAGMKGLVANPAGEIIELPVKNSFKEGLSVLEYFISTHGARKGTADTALRTSTSGYLTRRLVDVAHDVIVTEDDCGDTKGIVVKRSDSDKINQDFVHKIYGRVVLENVTDPDTKEVIAKKGEIIDWNKAKKIKLIEKIETVKVRSPLSCKTKRGICKKCYGLDLGWRNQIEKGEAVGIIAAQAIGEPGTQLTMRTFHTGGVAGEADITRGLPRIEEVFEKRVPKGEAVICAKKGKVVDIDEGKGLIKILTVPEKESKRKRKEEIKEYNIPLKVEILVKNGEIIEKGSPLCAGSLDLKKLFKLVGKDDTQKHIIEEIQKVYVSQGVSINDKHVEVIVRQMFSRVKVKKSGDSAFVPGEIISRARAKEENERLEKEAKEKLEIQDLILGISKVALNTDSFLSSASFQETSRVLIRAALRGEEDKLLGLKENVILGKLVPIGTGVQKEEKSN